MYVHHASQKSSHRFIRQGGRGYESVFSKFRFLGVRWINLVKEEKGVLSVISRPGGVNVEVGFYAKIP
jgi:hypothetical protein